MSARRAIRVLVLACLLVPTLAMAQVPPPPEGEKSLADTYHGFYENCPVLRADGVTRSTRLLLCELTARTLKCGLNLLGIEAPDRM